MKIAEGLDKPYFRDESFLTVSSTVLLLPTHSSLPSLTLSSRETDPRKGAGQHVHQRTKEKTYASQPHQSHHRHVPSDRRP